MEGREHDETGFRPGGSQRDRPRVGHLHRRRRADPRRASGRSSASIPRRRGRSSPARRGSRWSPSARAAGATRPAGRSDVVVRVAERAARRARGRRAHRYDGTAGAPERVRRSVDRRADGCIRGSGRRTGRGAERRRAVVLGRRRRRMDALVDRSSCTTRTSKTRSRCARCSMRSTGAPRRSWRGCRATRSAAGAGSLRAATSSSPSRRRSFAFSEVKLGIVPAVISPFALAKIGSRRPGAGSSPASGSRPTWRCASGSSTRSRADLDAAVDAESSASCSRPAPRRRGRRRSSREHPHDRRETARLIAGRRTSDEGQEGLRAFLDKRPPAWRGS